MAERPVLISEGVELTVARQVGSRVNTLYRRKGVVGCDFVMDLMNILPFTDQTDRK